MKLGLVIYGSLDSQSGGYLYDRMLMDFLRRQGDEVEVVSYAWSNYLSHLGHNFQPALVQRLQALQVDVLLQDELNHPSLAWANDRLQGRSFPIISIVHHLRSSERHPAAWKALYRQVEKRYLSGVDAFIWNSQTTRQVVEGLLGAPRRGLVAYPAGDRLGCLTEEEMNLRSKEGGPLRLLFIGNLIPRKGLDTLIQALARLPQGSWSLRVVGRPDVDPAYTRRVRFLAHALNLQASIQFLGALSDEALADELRKAQVMAMVSSYEGFGIVYLEGLGFGLPAIASTAGAAGEIIQNGVSGWLVDPQDVAGLAAAIGRYQASRQTLLEHSLAARKRFGQFPGWEDSAASIRRFLLDLLQTDWKGRS